ncbi:TMAO reductase system periplasmic protein TorT [Pseudoalteromonas sp. NBT06-2]|uniref:TMAO reductase system periplasmic protein TorT n=1 Tax=Pseudoalteromonas sp. NBT06-2 TaxID=2025950 RepID=UPI002572EE26|nr:TMAO reductase system periplasmic protein TorT [Pseudoalteromonas sp. NBT06-2]
MDIINTKVLFLLVCFMTVSYCYADWQPLKVYSWPININSWEPKEIKREVIKYHSLKTAKKQWKICVSIPHLKDSYWLAVNYALIDQAKHLGIRMRIKQAGGYTELASQRTQIKECMASGADGLILSSVDTDKNNDLVQLYHSQGKLVVDLINWISSKHISARVAVNYFDNGVEIAKYLLKHAKEPSKVLWLPGPKGPGWPAAGNKGFIQELTGSDIEIVHTAWGDTGYRIQSKLIRDALEIFPDIDYIVGTTVSADAAIDIIRQKNQSASIGVLSYYFSSDTFKAIQRDQIIAAATDKQAIQARLSVDIIVRLLEGDDSFTQIAPLVEIVDKKTLNNFISSTSVAPRGFRPVFSVNDWSN